MKRLLIFHHYNKYNSISEYVLCCLQAIRNYFDFIVFTSNSHLSIKDKDLLKKEYCNIILNRENKGFDFGAWKDAINFIGFNKITNYDCLVIMNDTCFGPLFDIGEVFRSMEEKNVDFWGITNHRKTPTGMTGTNDPIPEHIQSYYICFNKKVIASKIFQKFWLTVDENLMEVNKVIQKYETQLTKILSEEGFLYDVYIDTTKNNFIHPNVLNCHTDILLLKYKLPFVKVKTFLGNFERPEKILNIIENKYRYPLQLIENHIYKLLNPNDTIYFKNLYVDKIKKNHELTESFDTNKMAIHIHIASINTFFNCINVLKNTQYQYDLFVSTDSENKAKKIKNILIENDIYNKIKMQDIIVYPQFKGDIYPLISSFEFLKDKYTIIGYIHINKVYGFFKRIWLRRMLKRILNIDNILQVFSQNKNIGIIITDIYNLIKNKSNLSWGKNKDIYVELWEYMKCKKEFCIDKYEMPIMPSELMFWYKKEALQPIYEINLETAEGLLEKFHFREEKSIFEAIEKLFVYVAWDNNYDYRVIVDKNTDISKIERRIMFLKLLLNKRNKIIKWWKIFNDKGFLFTLNLIVYELNKKLGFK